MCGLVGFLLRYDPRPQAPDLGALEALAGRLEVVASGAADGLLAEAERAAHALVLWGGFLALASDEQQRTRARELARAFGERADALESELAALADAQAVEEGSLRLVRLRDLSWRIERDALDNLARAEAWFGAPRSQKHLFEQYRLVIVLNNLARLEVRGRDSGGLAILATVPEAAYAELEAGWAATGEFARRREIPDFRHRSIAAARAGQGRVCIAFAHKEAREIGELGANIRALQESIAADSVLADLLAREDCQVTLMAHNRWASNGIINDANCHPLTDALDGEELGAGLRARLVMGALNGDIDNYPTLVARMRSTRGVRIAPTITTDAKIIPVELAARLADAGEGEAAWMRAARETLADFEGSFAIAAALSDEPGAVVVAQRGSGQALYVGLAPDGGLLYASELYGVVELCSEYIRLEGAGEDGGELAALSPGQAPRLFGLDGAERGLEGRAKSAPITTRDINKADFDHYLLKEINEASRSVERTLRGRLTIHGEEPSLQLEAAALPEALRAALSGGELRRVFIIGQGTASIAANAIADMLAEALREVEVPVLGLKATELSGFHMASVDAQALVIAVSQSGTTTDTNRTVDLARERGARVLAIVNRRASDLAFKADGVLYTSDGRDIEMSVASTKAFYCQVVAGYLLAAEISRLMGASAERERVAFLRELADLPRRMVEVIGDGQGAPGQRDKIRGIARAHAGRRRYWAVVGSGPGRIAAEEIRIKLSELCYKSMSSDTIEDKKHIDLSAEALIFVCAAGLSGTTAADAVKEIGIFKAHAALPIVVCDRGETRFAPYASAVIEVPASSPRIALLLNALVGHLFGYYAALALDAGAQQLRRIRELVERTLSELDELAPTETGRAAEAMRRFRELVTPQAREVLADLHEGRFNSGLQADLAFRLGDALRLCLGQLSYDAVASYVPTANRREQLEVAMASLSAAIDQLVRPIDAIKHQAKTVTVGISREAASLPVDGQLTAALVEAGVEPHRLDEPTAATLASFDPFVSEVLGCTIYAVENLTALGLPRPDSRIRAVTKTGVAAQMRSRVDAGGELTGTKRMVVSAPRVYVGRGASDERSLVIAPLFENGLLTGLGLIHVAFREDLEAAERVQALRIAGRFEDLRARVTETDPRWDDAILERLSVPELLGSDLASLAEQLTGPARG